MANACGVNMQPELFSDNNTYELQYAIDLKESAAKDQAYFISNGIIPPWIDAELLLDKSERRLLELIEEHSGYVKLDDDWHVIQYQVDGARRVSGLTIALGMNAEVNSKAVVNKVVYRGLVTVTRDNCLSGNRLDMTRLGRYYLDICQDDSQWEFVE